MGDYRTAARIVGMVVDLEEGGNIPECEIGSLSQKPPERQERDWTARDTQNLLPNLVDLRVGAAAMSVRNENSWRRKKEHGLGREDE